MPEFSHTITLERADDIAILRFDSDHPANVFTLPMLEEITSYVDGLAVDRPCRVLVITGRDKIFSGGADLHSIQEMNTETYVKYVETEYQLFRKVEILPFITIASIAGACVGNAAELAMSCDFRFAADNVKIGWPELNVAFDAPAQRLARFLGIGRAKELLFSARLLRAEEALSLGLLTAVVPRDELVRATREAAELYASRPPIGIALTKENIERAYSFPIENFDMEINAAAIAFATEDFQEGASSVLDGRPPDFTGR